MQKKIEELDDVVKGLEGAVGTVKRSLKAQKGVKVNLIQVKSLLQKLSKWDRSNVKVQGNTILATLEGLLATTKKQRAQADLDMTDAESIFGVENVGVLSKKKFAEKAKAEAEKLSAAHAADLATSRESHTQETDDRDADQSFLDAITTQCDTKAKEYEQRSQTRTAELKALDGAIEQVAIGAKKESSNKNLVGFVQLHRSPSFIQLRQVGGEAKRTRAVYELLQEAGKKSAFLRGAAARVLVSADNLTKVRDLIKALLTKLETDKTSEAEQKAYCDKYMTESINSRDAAKLAEETASATIATLTSDIDTLTSDIAALDEAVAANAKGLQEATDLRTEEKADNEKTLEDGKEGKAAIDTALTILEGFYGSTAFVQTSKVKKYSQPVTDRDGKTVDDFTPEDMFEGEYNGAKAESKGIIGMLEVIQTDLQRTIDTVEVAETSAITEYDEFKAAKEADSTAKEADRKAKDETKADKEVELIDQQDSLSEAEADLGISLSKLEELKASCVEGSDSYRVAQAARAKELEQLRDAQKLLEELD
jgi:hypothetical protein